MSLKKILIRADGSKSIGMGHLARAVLLTKKLKGYLDVAVITVLKRNEQAIDFIKNKQIDALYIDEKMDFESEAAELLKIIKKESIDLLVLDLLDQDLDLNFMSILRQSNAKILAITDDSFKRPIEADIVINGNPNQLGLNYSSESAKYYLGPEYFIMDERFGSLNYTKSKQSKKNVLITVGGSDHNDLLFKIIDAFNSISGNYNLLIAVSKASGYLDRLYQHLEEVNFDYELFIDMNGLYELWARSDIAITAGGNTLFERIASGVPGLTICQLQRQMEIADCFERLGVNTNLGYGPELSENDISKGIVSFLLDKEAQEHQISKCPKTLDGLGLNRVVKLVIDSIKE